MELNTRTDGGPNSERRHFLTTAGALGARLAHALRSPAQAPPTGGGQEKPESGGDAGEIPRRALGRTGAVVSALGLGGHHLGDVATVEEAVRIVHEANDAGITFFDNCLEYYNGKTEDWLGRALVGRRDKVFLMTKVCTHGRDARTAMAMLEQSLRRLRTDHLDL